jgi:tetratricopeptide (TPR) repeat protein
MVILGLLLSLQLDVRAAQLYRDASISADFGELRKAELAIDEAMRDEPSLDMLLLRASFHFKMHRLRQAKEDLAAIPEPARGTAARTLAAQIALQEGDYDTAGRELQFIADKWHTWDSLASLAYLKSVTGDPRGAGRLYAEAEEELTAKEMRSFAWVEVQRGLLEFDRGHYANALVHYRRADAAYPHYWLVEEHIAEVLDRMGQTGRSVAMYEQVIARTHNPEYIAALAAIVARSDRDAAAKLYAEADARYDAQMRLYPEAAGGHLIRYLLTRNDDAKLIALAEQNAALRPNGEAKLLLAKAYAKCGRGADAQRVLSEIMRTRWRTPELLAFARNGVR